jgi:hypothetical protein
VTVHHTSSRRSRAAVLALVALPVLHGVRGAAVGTLVAAATQLEEELWVRLLRVAGRQCAAAQAMARHVRNSSLLLLRFCVFQLFRQHLLASLLQTRRIDAGRRAHVNGARGVSRASIRVSGTLQRRRASSDDARVTKLSSAGTRASVSFRLTAPNAIPHHIMRACVTTRRSSVRPAASRVAIKKGSEPACMPPAVIRALRGVPAASDAHHSCRRERGEQRRQAAGRARRRPEATSTESVVGSSSERDSSAAPPKRAWTAAAAAQGGRGSSAAPPERGEQHVLVPPARPPTPASTATRRQTNSPKQL